MKKLTPFRKKVARWFNKHNKIHNFVCGVAAMMLFSPLALLFVYQKELERSSPSNLADVKFLFATFFIMGTFFLVLECLTELPEKLPEANIEPAKKAAEKYPQIADLINQFTEEAIREDDGVKIRRYLKKLRELECLKSPDSDTAKKIAALEKELGMSS